MRARASPPPRSATIHTRTLDELAATYGELQLALLAADPPTSGAWSYELKFDGYRMLALKSGAETRLVSRSHLDWTGEFAPVAEALTTLRADQCAVDGEVCALDADGASSFQRLQNRDAKTHLVFFVFDCLMLNGEDLRERPIEERRAKLADVLTATSRKRGIILSSAVDSDPHALLKLACKAGLEGIIAKAAKSPYVGGRGRGWLKLKCAHRQEFAILGWLPLLKTRPAVGSLLLGLKGSDGFSYAGKVGTGFTDAQRKNLFDLLQKDVSSTPSAPNVPRFFEGLVRYVKPRLVAEVSFTEWTDDGNIRHPSFHGLRDDKRTDECVREDPSPAPRSASGPAVTRNKKPAADRISVGGISLSHPSRTLDPAGITKLELARYYEAIGPTMLRHVAGRPLTLVRWAEGKEAEKGGVYLRHARAWGPSDLRRVPISEKKKTGEYLVADSEAALVALAQMDILEIHTWNSVADDLERPNRVVFDLDPAPDVSWKRVVAAAKDVRDRLREQGLESWVKTTGGKGLHVVVPLTPGDGWDACFAFTRAFAFDLVKRAPARYLATMSKAARTGRIFIDYLRNNRTSTSVAAYSTRARAGAPVSTPVRWEELDTVRATKLTPTTVVARVRSEGDPWEGYWPVEQRLPRS